jgi:hypothetical protein
MADTVEKNIFQAVVNRMKAVQLPAGMTLAANVVLPGVPFSPQATTKYISFEMHFNRSIRTDLSQTIPPIRQGFIRGNVMWPKGYSQVDAIDVAGSVCLLFQTGTKLYEDDVQVRFDEDPEIGVLMVGSTHFMVPVTADWRSYPKVTA